MWILFPHMRKEVHTKRMGLGVIGYFIEGPKRVAVVETIEIIGLHSNPHS